MNQHIEIAEKKSKKAKDRLIPFSEYAVATFHRSENDDRTILTNIVNGLSNSEIPIIIPKHPRTKKMLRHFDLLTKLSKDKNILIMGPQGYLEFLLLMKHSRLIITDSGGIQEEATAPSICRSHSTTVIAQEIKTQCVTKFKPLSKNPYGDGFASKRIMHVLNRIRK